MIQWYHQERNVPSDKAQRKETKMFINKKKVLEEVTRNDYKDTNGKFVVPKEVEMIQHAAFRTCDDMKSVVISDGVKKIVSSAFELCRGLREVYIGKDVEDIGESVFSDCHQIEKIIVDERNPFYRVTDNCLIENQSGRLLICYKGNTIPNDGSIYSIGVNAFSNRDDLRSIVIPEGVTAIDCRAFEKCYYLEEVILPESLKYIEGSAFCNCQSLETISFGSNLDCIGDRAFMYCYSLKNVTIPDNVRYIGEAIFADCIELENVSLGRGIRVIPSCAFTKCEKLSRVAVKYPVYIGYNTFSESGMVKDGFGLVPFEIKMENGERVLKLQDIKLR